MAITMFSKKVNDIESVNDALFNESCEPVQDILKTFFDPDNPDSYECKTYEDWAYWALDLCQNNLPSPTSLRRGATLNLGPNYFTVGIPNEFKIGLKYNTRNDSSFLIDIIFNVPESTMVNTDEYRDLKNNGWEIREISNSK